MEVRGHQLNADLEVKLRSRHIHQPKENTSKFDPNVSIRHPSILDMLSLMAMKISPLYKRIDEEGGSDFGHIAAMTSCAKGQLGALNAGSFCERCMYCANLIVTDGNVILLDDEVVLLRMNF